MDAIYRIVKRRFIGSSSASGDISMMDNSSTNEYSLLRSGKRVARALVFDKPTTDGMVTSRSYTDSPTSPLPGDLTTDLFSEPDEENCDLLGLPTELLTTLLDNMEVKDLAATAQACTRLRTLASADRHWQALFIKRWGSITPTLEVAATLAGSWQQLYAAKHIAERDSAPWITPSRHEVDAVVERMKGPKCETGSQAELVVIFLVDGSGSVTEEDFSTMTRFLKQAVESIKVTHELAKVGVIQFSNEVRIELAPRNITPAEFAQVVDEMARMNGGTNIASPIRKAEKLLREGIPYNATRVIALLTDGRVDSHQAREAVERAERVADELENVSLFAFGVGRGVDKAELTRIVSAVDGNKHGDNGRYLGLRTLEEAPW
eukprot:jgi/Chlat1/6222/Chrsp44S05811